MKLGASTLLLQIIGKTLNYCQSSSEQLEKCGRTHKLSKTICLSLFQVVWPRGQTQPPLYAANPFGLQTLGRIPRGNRDQKPTGVGPELERHSPLSPDKRRQPSEAICQSFTVASPPMLGARQPSSETQFSAVRPRFLITFIQIQIKMDET